MRGEWFLDKKSTFKNSIRCIRNKNKKDRRPVFLSAGDYYQRKDAQGKKSEDEELIEIGGLCGGPKGQKKPCGKGRDAQGGVDKNVISDEAAKFGRTEQRVHLENHGAGMDKNLKDRGNP